MRIAMISTDGTSEGGAARAMLRLAAGLRQLRHEVVVFSSAERRAAGGIGIQRALGDPRDDPLAEVAGRYLEQRYLAPRRTSLSNTLFLPQVSGYRFADSKILDGFDLVNVHWVGRFVAPHGVAEIAARGKPVLCTLHDMAPFTGGCHYSAGCTGYRQVCRPCPQLGGDPLQLPSWTLAAKRQMLRRSGVAAVAPSRWLADCAVMSEVFAPDAVSHIPNAIETDLFVPTRTAAAKAALGLEPDTQTLLFGAQDQRERRKGYDLLLAMVEQLLRDARIRKHATAGRLCILTFGGGTPELRGAGIPLRDLGYIADDQKLALAYSAADLTVLASREDNLPNVLLESMACGTPVVGFAVGGIAETISDGMDGRLIAPLDVPGMASAVAEVLCTDRLTSVMGAAAREKILAGFTLEAQAARYEMLLETLLQTAGRVATDAAAESTPWPETIDLPLTLHPEVARTPIGLVVEQQARIERAESEAAATRYELARVRDVLHVAAAEVIQSGSWRYTGPLRRWAGDVADPRLTSEATAEQAAVTVLTLLRSKSWELTAPFRLLGRIWHALWRRIVRRNR